MAASRKKDKLAVAARSPRPRRDSARLGPGRNRIYCGDAAAVLAKLGDGSVDLAVTSPPYDNLRDYQGYSFDFDGICSQLYRVLRKGGVLVWVVGDRIAGGRSLTSFRQGLAFQDLGFSMHDIMIYRKKNTPFMRSNAYTNCYEFMFVLSKGRPRVFRPIMEKTKRSGMEMLVHNKKSDGINKKTLAELKPEKTRTNIWDYAVGLGGTTCDRFAFKHPAMFPEKLAQDHILSWSKPGDLVLDPMCGSGTTCKMAAANGRDYIGIEISKEYAAIARRRMAGIQKRISAQP
ncbi:DNA modification methylase [Cenarchaeum symbiosum A]|uniref:Type II methyltransferase n=1 Tax=Cenarchaeum symbiosum (strain A) TaxID=414004 RepID=A0RUY4_CENSY|nr:DNA modification methylase [Cenarchaeum symbiosum A]